jgi:hypothetical protein
MKAMLLNENMDNLVFGIHFHDDGEVVSAMADIMVFNQLALTVITMVDEKKNPTSKYDMVISMSEHALTYIEEGFNGYVSSGVLLEAIENAMEKCLVGNLDSLNEFELHFHG